jgi:hypothetical protein
MARKLPSSSTSVDRKPQFRLRNRQSRPQRSIPMASHQSADSWLGELSSMRSCRKDLSWVELADLADSMAVGEASSSQQKWSLDRTSLLDNGNTPMGILDARAEAGTREAG